MVLLGPLTRCPSYERVLRFLSPLWGKVRIGAWIQVDREPDSYAKTRQMPSHGSGKDSGTGNLMVVNFVVNNRWDVYCRFCLFREAANC